VSPWVEGIRDTEDGVNRALLMSAVEAGTRSAHNWGSRCPLQGGQVPFIGG